MSKKRGRNNALLSFLFQNTATFIIIIALSFLGFYIFQYAQETNAVVGDVNLAGSLKPQASFTHGTAASTSTTAVVGTGTTFLTKARVGDRITLSTGGTRTITAIADDTHLTVDTAYSGASGTITIVPSSFRATDSSGNLQMVLDSLGYVGIGTGTAPPKNKLDVGGAMALGSFAGSSAAPSNGLIVSGNVGIGDGTPGQELEVSGDISMSGSTGTIYGPGSQKTFGALTIDGTKGGYNGINFVSGATNYGTLMATGAIFGWYNNSDNNWDFYFSDGNPVFSNLNWTVIGTAQPSVAGSGNWTTCSASMVMVGIHKGGSSGDYYTDYLDCATL